MFGIGQQVFYFVGIDRPDYQIGLPVIKSFARYRAPLTFMERIKIYASISEYENYLCFDFAIKTAAAGKLVTTGYTKHAAFDLNKRELPPKCGAPSLRSRRSPRSSPNPKSCGRTLLKSAA